MKKIKILITGGCGFVGSNLCIYLKKNNYSIYSLDNLSRKGSKFNLKLLNKLKIKNFNYDISNKKQIKSLPKFDIVIDCCAEAAVEFSKKNVQKVIDTNLIGTINILEKIEGTQYLLFSTFSGVSRACYSAHHAHHATGAEGVL